MRTEILLAGLLAATLLASGCIENSAVETSKDKITVEGNETKELGFRAVNNFNETTSFTAELVPQNTERQYFRILRDGEERTEFDLGDARPEKKTGWKYVQIKGIPENIDGKAIALDLTVNIYQGQQAQPLDNKTIEIGVLKD